MLNKILLLLAVLIFSVFSCSLDSAREFIFVVDTSGSMSEGKPQEQTINRVKNSMGRLANLMRPKDQVYLVSFDDGVREHLDIELSADSYEEDKQQIVDTVQNLQAKGSYTDMGAMLQKIRGYLSNRPQQERDVYVIILSDGIDDPNPRSAKNRNPIEIDELAYGKRPSGSFEDVYIYYLSVGLLLDKDLLRELQILSGEENIVLLEEKDPATSIGNLVKDIERRGRIEKIRSWLKEYQELISGLIMLAILILFINLHIKRHKLNGKLLYYESRLGDMYTKSLRLDRLGKHRIRIGNTSGSDLRIRKLEIKHPVVLRTKELPKGAGLGIVCTRGGKAMQYLRQKNQGVISHEDVFSIGNFTFIYEERQKNKKTK